MTCLTAPAVSVRQQQFHTALSDGYGFVNTLRVEIIQN